MNANKTLAAGRTGGRMADITTRDEGNFIDSPEFPELNQKLAELGEKYSATKAAIALSWLTRLPYNVQPIVGSTNPQRVRDMSRAGDITLTREEWYELYRSAGKRLP